MAGGESGTDLKRSATSSTSTTCSASRPTASRDDGPARGRLRPRRRRQDGADARPDGPAGVRRRRRPAPGHRRGPVLRRRAARTRLRAHGVETIRCDLLDPDAARPAARRAQRRLHGRHEVRHHRPGGADLGDERLPARPGLPAGSAAAGSSPSPPATSTGSTPVAGGGSRETDPPRPGRRVRDELPGPRADLRALQPRRCGIPIGPDPPELRDARCATACWSTSAERVRDGEPIDLAMGHFNVDLAGGRQRDGAAGVRPRRDARRACST